MIINLLVTLPELSCHILILVKSPKSGALNPNISVLALSKLFCGLSNAISSLSPFLPYATMNTLASVPAPLLSPTMGVTLFSTYYINLPVVTEILYLTNGTEAIPSSSCAVNSLSIFLSSSLLSNHLPHKK